MQTEEKESKQLLEELSNDVGDSYDILHALVQEGGLTLLNKTIIRHTLLKLGRGMENSGELLERNRKNG